MPRHILSLIIVVLSLIFTGLFSKPTTKPTNADAVTPNSIPNKAPVLTPISIYGAWHCGNDFCTWSAVRNMRTSTPKIAVIIAAMATIREFSGC